MKLSSIVKSYFSELYSRILYNKESITSYIIGNILGYFIFSFLGFEMKTSRLILCNLSMIASFIAMQLNISILKNDKNCFYSEAI